MPSPRSSLESRGVPPLTCGTDNVTFAQDGEAGVGIDSECFGRGREVGVEYDDPFGATRRDVERKGMRLIVDITADTTDEPMPDG